MKPMCMPSATLATLLEFDCKLEVLMEMPNAVSAEDGFFPRRSTDHPIQKAAPAAFLRDKDEELALRIEAFRESPRLPGISWVFRG